MICVGIPMSIISSAVNPMPDQSDMEKLMLDNQEINWEYVILGENPEVTIAITIIYHAIAFAIAVYLIRRWSKKWNLQFD